ncbi:TBC1 domain family member 13 protein [Pelomyxa schiedti]|nr:TBC1 domain family member 13 protein [Pelomyxa schiedti]
MPLAQANSLLARSWPSGTNAQPGASGAQDSAAAGAGTNATTSGSSTPAAHGAGKDGGPSGGEESEEGDWDESGLEGEGEGGEEEEEGSEGEGLGFVNDVGEDRSVLHSIDVTTFDEVPGTATVNSTSTSTANANATAAASGVKTGGESKGDLENIDRKERGMEGEGSGAMAPQDISEKTRPCSEKECLSLPGRMAPLPPASVSTTLGPNHPAPLPPSTSLGDTQSPTTAAPLSPPSTAPSGSSLNTSSLQVSFTPSEQGATSEASPAAPRLSKFDLRIAMFKEVIAAPTCDLSQLRSLAFSGVPDSVPGLRPTYWKILLKYLPLKASEREETVHSCRTQYWEYFHELIVHPNTALESIQRNKRHPVRVPQKMTESPVFEGGLKHLTDGPEPSPTTQSTWNKLFINNETWEQIDKDVKRTLPDMNFFDNVEQHESLQHILFIYSKLNARLSYVQGMNEIAGRIYYVFASDRDPETRANAEADTFFCFLNLMSEIMDLFLKTVDGEGTGVDDSLTKLDDMLHSRDPKLWRDLQDKGIDPHFYAFRWMTLLLCQEFELPEVLRLWDSFFADEGRFSFVIYFCCAMLISLRDKLLSEPFAENLQMLQNYPSTGLDKLFALAVSLRDTPITFSTCEYEDTEVDDQPSKKSKKPKHRAKSKSEDATTLASSGTGSPLPSTATPPQKAKNRIKKTLANIHHKTSHQSNSTSTPISSTTTSAATSDSTTSPTHKHDSIDESDFTSGSSEKCECVDNSRGAKTTWCSGARPSTEHENKKSFL